MVSVMTVTPLPQRRGWVPDDSDFGARLALVRQHLGGLNITKAAAICGVNPESWRTWEAGKTKPRDLTDIAGKIARATGVDYVWMMLGSSIPEAVAGGRAGTGGADVMSSGDQTSLETRRSGGSDHELTYFNKSTASPLARVFSLAEARARRAGVAA